MAHISATRFHVVDQQEISGDELYLVIHGHHVGIGNSLGTGSSGKIGTNAIEIGNNVEIYLYEADPGVNKDDYVDHVKLDTKSYTPGGEFPVTFTNDDFLYKATYTVWFDIY